MAKRELSSTLKNLKFMQRAVQREEKDKFERDTKTETNFVLTTEKKRCLVIMEGGPPVGAISGRMSFQGFNPSVEKQNEEVERHAYLEEEATASSVEQNAERENGFPKSTSQDFETAGTSKGADADHKRKYPETDTEKHNPNKNGCGEVIGQVLPNKNKASNKQQKREKLDWSVLRPPKYQNRRG